MFDKLFNRIAKNIADRVILEIKGKYSYKEFLPPVVVRDQIYFMTKDDDDGVLVAGRVSYIE